MSSDPHETPPGGWLPQATELPPPPPPPPRRPRARIAAVLAVAVLAVGATAAVIGLNSDTRADLAVGDCLDLVADGSAPAGEQGFAARADQTSCSDPSAAYEVAIRLENPAQQCPSTIYTTHVHEDSVRLCLTYNVADGDCFVEAPPDSGPFDCAAGPRPGAIKVLRIVDGVADTDRCADLPDEGLLAVTVPEPPTTFCFIDFGARDGGTVST